MTSAKRQAALVALSHLQVDKTSDGTMRRSLYARVRAAILSGSLKPEARLPSTRALATELGISRNTISDAFAQLVAEGLLVARPGSGTYVAKPRVVATPVTRTPTAWERASSRGKLLAERSEDDSLKGRPSFPFQPGVPSYEHFPFETWARIAARIIRRPRPALLGYGDSAGYRPLREAIAAEVRARGGQPCSDEQIIVVGGTTQALDLVCRLTLDPGDEVWLEDASSLYVRSTLTATGSVLVPVPVDSDGINVDVGIGVAPEARLVHVTSAHQWPLGATLSQERRQRLLQWAENADAWIVEDEYDGVFRYDGSRPEPLRAMDAGNRVIAIGTFSVTTFPAIRVGYIVAPPTLIDAFVAAKATADRQASQFEQAILAEFIYDGHYAKYRKTMEGIYSDRQDALIARVAELGGPRIEPTASGLHVVLPLESTVDDRAVAANASRLGIATAPLSVHYLAGEGRRSGLILGFGAGRRDAMEVAANRLCRDVLRVAPVGAGARLAYDVPG